MTNQCDFKTKAAGRCTEPGTVQPKRWTGCLCESHAQFVEELGRGLLILAIDLAKQGRERRESKAA